MPDEEEKAPLNDAKAEEGKEEKKDEDKGESFCFQYGKCIVTVFKKVYAFLKWLILTIGEFLGLCWYPFKERTNDMCDCCGKRLNPHTDPAYSGF